MMLRVPGFARSLARHRLAMLSVALFALVSQSGWSTDVAVPAVVDRIEEDWYLLIGEPDVENDSPQILNVISPFATTEGAHAIFELNHCTQPEYLSGGLQLQRWTGPDTCVATTRTIDRGAMAIPAEEITYTMRMSLHDGNIYYSVRNGVSQTWGTFGTYGQYRLSAPIATTTLAGYRPDFSVAESKVAFGAHRVKTFKIKQIRYYSLGQLVATDSTERVVHQYDATSPEATIPVADETP